MTHLKNPDAARRQITIAGKKAVLSGLNDEDPYFRAIGDEPEHQLYSVICRYLSPDSVAVDIGANIGITSLLLSRHLPNGRVFAFEPSPGVFSVLKDNLHANQAENVIPANCAMGFRAGEMGFADASAFGHLLDEGSMLRARPSITIPVRTVDDFVLEAGLDRVDFVKIDVEGFEYDVLRGMERTEREFRPLVYFEFNSWCQIAYKNQNPRELLDYALSYFKQVYRFGPNNELVQLNEENAVDFLYDNLLHHACVDNLLATNEPGRLVLSNQWLQESIMRYLEERNQAIGERNQAMEERDQAIEERDQALGEAADIKSSRSWRFTSPLRSVIGLLKAK